MRMPATIITVLSIVVIIACNKTSGALSAVSLTPSATTVITGQTVSVALTSNTNASRWTVTPSLTSKATYTITTAKVNYFTFTKPGVYTIGVSIKNVLYDSASSQSLDSCWIHSVSASGCVKGIDSASAKITVTD